MAQPVFTLLLFISVASAHIFHRNLAYSSPYYNNPELSILHQVEKRVADKHLARRQTQDNTFNDGKYPTFYGADFSNSPYVWQGGINFTHSVASGDPFDTSVILWTRAAPAAGGTPDVSVPICVSWRISEDASSGDSVTSGEAFTSYDVDFTVKVEATDLSPDTKYYFQFSDCTNRENVSPFGTTRTLPSPDAEPSTINSGNPLKFAVFSCSKYEMGWFNAYGVSTNVSADFYVHLGDYTYEYADHDGASIGRPVTGKELSTIADYRQRLAQYRTDAYLVEAHRIGPWITTWDDHEVADNSWKAGTADSNDSTITGGCSFGTPSSGACFTDRKWAAVRAYHEWMPIRQVDQTDKLRIWRNFQVGKLLDLTMLDTRQYDRDITDIYRNTDVGSLADFGNRSIMGAAQEKWFHDTLSESVDRGAIWRVVGQQVIFTQIDFGNSFNYDQWDGYRANRNRIYDQLYQNNISNVVFLAGDSHANWVSDLSRPNGTDSYDPETGEGAVGVEFAGTAVTSGSSFGEWIAPDAADVISAALVELNEDLQWSEGSYRGFFTLTINADQLNATYYAMNNTRTQNLDNFVSAVFTVRAGENRLSRPVAGGSVEAGVLKF